MKQSWKDILCSFKSVEEIAKHPHKLGAIIGYDLLTEMHSEWIRYIWDSNEPRALQAFRGGYKTTSILIVGSVRWLLFNPNERIVLIRKTFTDSARIVASISRVMKLPHIIELFKYVHGENPVPLLERKGEVSYSFKKFPTVEASITAKGFNETIIGTHTDKLICDDIITLSDRISKAERIHTKEIIRELFTNIIDPGRGAACIGTPWHREDGWREIEKYCKIAKFPVSKYNFLSPDIIAKKKATTTPYLFAANYELELTSDDSLLFKDPKFPFSWDYSKNDCYAQLDTAFDGTHYCALTIASTTRFDEGRQFYQAVGFSYAGNVSDWYDAVSDYCHRYNVKSLYVEDNADKGATSKALISKGLPVIPYSEGMNKHIKIGTFLYPVFDCIEWASETDEEYMSQIVDYREHSSPDDAPDSAASLFRFAFSNRGVIDSSSKEWLFSRS